jgi:predicted TIM-barrel fold metal-dependent hydrolase
MQERLGLARAVIVQPSVYGSDNSCTIDAVRELGARARGVAVIAPRTLPDELERMNRAGIRGVRINLQTSGGDPAWIAKAAALVAPLGWHVQVLTRIAVLRHLPALPVPLVVDHFGLPASMEDVRYLAALLREGNTYVKLSGSHRLAMDAGAVARALLEANPERCLWGSDRPHPFTGARDPSKVQPFDAVDESRPSRAFIPGRAMQRSFETSSPTTRRGFTISRMGAAVIETEVFAELPARLRKSGTPPERLAAGKSATPMGSFLEGPSFDRDGNLYVVDLAWGRIFRVNENGEFHVVIEYDGEPNGLAIHKNGRIFVADHKHGILRLENGSVVPVVSRYHQQTFKGVNDLTFDPQGNLYFTDQGVTDLENYLYVAPRARTPSGGCRSRRTAR